MNLPVFVIAEWATPLVDIRCPRSGSPRGALLFEEVGGLVIFFRGYFCQKWYLLGYKISDKVKKYIGIF